MIFRPATGSAQRAESEKTMTDSTLLSPRRAEEIPPLTPKKKRTVWFYACAFLIPSLIMWLVYIALEVFPFGENSVLVLDLNGQYVYFFEDLRNKLTSGGSLLYTWSRALGGENMGIFAYYVASPFSLLTLIFPKSMITEALLTMILCKIGSCGMSMAYYLKTTRQSSNHLGILIFSSMYALSAYSVVQAHNTMWIDALIFLPLVLLGIERLIARRTFVLYVASLAFCCMANFYIGYMVCLFSFFYFFYWYFAHNRNYENNIYEEKGHFLKSLGRMTLYSGIGVGISAVVLLPAYYALQFGKNEFSNPNYTFSQQFDFLDMVAKLFPGSYDTVRPEGLPFLYCGTLTLILLPLYFISKNVSAREKMLTGLLFAVMVVTFNGSTLDLIWHGFQRPNWLNYRYSFMVCFLMVVCAYRAFEDLTRTKYCYLLSVVGVLGVLLLVIQKQEYEWLDDLQCVWFSLLMLGVLVCALHPVAKGYLKQTGTTLVMIAVCFELFANALFCTMDLDEDVVISSRTSYTSYFNKVQPAVDALKAYDAENFGSVFYRLEKTTHRKTNDAMTLGTYGITNSTSTLNASVISLLADMGYASKSHWSKYLGGTPVSDSLLGIKYVIYEEPVDDLTREKIYTDTKHNLYGYYNPYALSLAYAADSAVYNINRDDYESPFTYLNALVTAILGSDTPVELFCPIVHTTFTDNLTKSYTGGYIKYTPVSESLDGTLSFSFDAPAESFGHEIFMYLPSDYPWECTLYINGIREDTYFGNETHRVFSLGISSADDSYYNISLSPNKDRMYMNTGDDFFYYMDTDVYRAVMEKIAQGNLQMDSFADTYITGRITVPDGMEVLYTSIPYDEGWHVIVDGEEAELHKTSGTLLAASITPGEHEIELYYMPSCYVIGWCVSIVSLCAFAVLTGWYIMRRKRRREICARALALAMHPDEDGDHRADADFTDGETDCKS